MEEDAKEAREKAKTEQENAIRKRKEEREEQEKRLAESRNEDTDTVSISESGRIASDKKIALVQAGTDNNISVEEKVDAIKMEPVIYTKTGETAKPESGTNISVSI